MHGNAFLELKVKHENHDKNWTKTQLSCAEKQLPQKAVF